MACVSLRNVLSMVHIDTASSGVGGEGGAARCKCGSVEMGVFCNWESSSEET